MKNPKIVVTDNRGEYYWKKYARSLITTSDVINKQKKVEFQINIDYEW